MKEINDFKLVSKNRVVPDHLDEIVHGAHLAYQMERWPLPSSCIPLGDPGGAGLNWVWAQLALVTSGPTYLHAQPLSPIYSELKLIIYKKKKKPVTLTNCYTVPKALNFSCFLGL